jgi:putative membrane protein
MPARADRRYTLGAMSQPASLPLPHPSRAFFVLNAALTVGVMSFLVWVVYVHPPRADAAGASPTLPAINAGLNALSAVLLGAALGAVKKRRYRLHAGLMLSALAVSGAFLSTYVYYHLHHGETHFTGTGAARLLYFALLISHLVISMVAFPMILTSIFLAASRRWAWHKAVSRYTFAAWMYVSVTGVIVYLALHG